MSRYQSREADQDLTVMIHTMQDRLDQQQKQIQDQDIKIKDLKKDFKRERRSSSKSPTRNLETAVTEGAESTHVALVGNPNLYDLAKESKAVEAFDMGSSDVVKQLVWQSYVIAVKKHYQDRDITISSQFFKWLQTLAALGVLAIQLYVAYRFNKEQNVLIESEVKGSTLPTNMEFPHLAALLMLSMTMFLNIYWHLAATFFAFEVVFKYNSASLWTVLILIMSFSQIIISFFLLVASYKLIILQDGTLNVFKSYAAVFFIYILDDRVGDFFHPFFKQYSSYMSFQDGGGQGHVDVARDTKQNLMTMLVMFFATITLGYFSYQTKNHVEGLSTTNELIGLGCTGGLGLAVWIFSRGCVDNFRRPQFDGDSWDKDADEGGEEEPVQNGHYQVYNEMDDEFHRYQ